MLGCGGEPRGACELDPAPGRVGGLCGLHNPEDVEAVPSARLLLVSEMRIEGWPGGGAIAASRLHHGASVDAPRRLWPLQDAAATPQRVAEPAGQPDCVEPPAAEAFAPHGIASWSGSVPGAVRVAVVSHAPREAIELFELAGRGDDATLTWRGCVRLPAETSGNDVAFAPDGEIVVTNYMPTPHGLRGAFYFLSGALGRETGDLLAWRRESGWRHLPGTQGASPNGVAVSPDGSHVLYAETGGGRVVRVPLAAPAAGRPRDEVRIPGKPDNLSWSPRGTLWVATHTSAPGFLACALGRSPCRSAWSLYEIDPDTLRATERLQHDGSAVGAVASAAEVEGRVYLGAVFGDRVGVWAPAP